MIALRQSATFDKTALFGNTEVIHIKIKSYKILLNKSGKRFLQKNRPKLSY